jgi:hypothetical protein
MAMQSLLTIIARDPRLAPMLPLISRERLIPQPTIVLRGVA